MHLPSVKGLCQFMRAKYCSLRFQTGRNCRFEKIHFSGLITKSTVIVGDNVTIWRGADIISLKGLPVKIGDNVFINRKCMITPNVTIGDNVFIGCGASLITNSHKIGPPKKRAGEVIFPPIAIGGGCWIGANSTILGNVSIGEGTIIAAGSVVTKDCESNCLYAGVPAKLIKRLD